MFISLKNILLSIAVSLLFSSYGQKSDSLMVRKIFDVALEQGTAYMNLHSLCKDIGHRLSGSPQAEMAVKWGYELLQSYQPDTVYLQEIQVPRWDRGTAEKAWMIDSEGKTVSLDVLALGGSVGTEGLMEGEVIEITSFEDLEAKKDEVKGKIVFFNHTFDPKLISGFSAYGACVSQRYNGPNMGGKYGAKAVVIRSLTHQFDEHPHTGSMQYEKKHEKIPGAALSNASGNLLEAALEKGKVNLRLQMNCKDLGVVTSYNVIAELKGTEHPDEYMVVGGHLDSWDVGEGAHDDGAGIVHSIEVLHIFKKLDIRPKHTLRVVLFMNEENGNNGGKSYAEITKKDKHILAVESDRGGFTPRGFAIDGDEDQIKQVKQFESLLKPYYLHYFEKGYAGVDVGPIKKYKKDVLMLGLVPDSQRYFDYHHAETDVFEAVNKRELELGAASCAAIIFLLDGVL